MSDPRLLVYGPYPDGQPRPAHYEWQSNERRWLVQALGTLPLGYVYLQGINSDGQPVAPKPIPTYGQSVKGAAQGTEWLAARYEYRATDRDGNQLGDLVPTVTDAVALIVGAAHSGDPAPEHVVPVRHIRH